MAEYISCAIAGAGPAAQAMGLALRDCGCPVSFVASRNPERAAAAAALLGAKPIGCREIPLHATHVLIAVSDRAIPAVAADLAGVRGKLRAALHLCGSHGAEILAPLAEAGVACGSLHPLQTLRDPAAGARDLRTATYAVSGDGEALQWAEELAAVLSGRSIRIPDSARPLYHAAAVTASNYLCALLDMAEQLLAQAGISGPEARAALGPIAEATLRNALERGPVEALTGPIVRGDADTVARQRSAIEEAAPGSVREAWQGLGFHALQMARQRGLIEEEAQRVLLALEGRQ